jgi:hypothetical protein
MITQIVVHLLPQEIDWFEWQSKQFKLGSYHLNSDDTIIIDVTLNLNLVDWGKSQLPKEFFITKFKQIEKLWDWAQTQFIIDEENKCLGCDDKRRESIHSTTSDNILYLDSDLIFSPELLYYMVEASKNIDNDYYIISPQISKLWDNTWDVLVNDKFINNIPSMDDYYSNDPFEIMGYDLGNIYLSPINGFKFGGGWFNLLSTNLLKLTDIPDSFGPYGIDDLYVMVCCDFMKQKNYNIQQYVLKGTIVTENFKYRWNPYKDLLYLINKQDEFRKQAESNLNTELKKFINKI